MRLNSRWLSLMIFALVLASVVPLAGAQMAGVTVDGTPALFVFSQTSALAYTEASGVDVIVNISGEDIAFNQFCGNALNIVNSGRPITDDESALCEDNGVQWVELLIAFDGVAVYGPDSEITCLPVGELGAVSAGRGREHQVFFMETIGADAFAEDFVALNDDGAVFDALSEGGMGYVSLAGALASGRTPLEIDGGAGCVAPSAITASSGEYVLGRSLYMYVNVGSAESPDIANYVDTVLAPDNFARLGALGLVEPGAVEQERNLRTWQDRATGRTPSAPPLEIAAAEGPDMTLIDGTAALGAVATQITGETAELTYAVDSNGTDEAFARLCNAEVDVVGAGRAVTDAEIAACADNGITFFEFLVGQDAQVVVTHRANDYATCLSTNQINLLFGEENADLISRWEQLQDGFPPFAVTAFTVDVAANVSAIESAVGFTSYSEYQANSGQLNGVAVNSGAGCVDPTPANIQSGAYPFVESAYVYVNAESAQRGAVQQLLLALLSGAGRDAIADTGLVPASEGTLAIGLDLLRTGTTGRFFSQ